MIDLAKKTSAELADLGASLNAAIAESQKQLDEINAALVKKGAATFVTNDGRVEVIVPGKAIKPGKEAIVSAKAICGAVFSKLFQRVVVIKPRKNFRSLAAAVLTPARCDKVIALCEVDSTAYVRYIV